jgi:hypothetical protein
VGLVADRRAEDLGHDLDGRRRDSQAGRHGVELGPQAALEGRGLLQADDDLGELLSSLEELDGVGANGAGLAVERIKKDLLPWVMERIKSGEPLEPPSRLAMATRIFEIFVGALTRAQYDMLLAKKEIFSAEERNAFVKLAEALKIVPAGAPATAPAAKDSAAGPGQAKK